MKIELTNLMPAELADRADGMGEAHIRVLTAEPVGPQVWDDVRKHLKESHDWFFGQYEWTPEKFFPELTELEEGETEYAPGFGWEQWFVVAEKRIR